MTPDLSRPCTAFADGKLVASGDVRTVALRLKEHLADHPKAAVLIFDDQTSRPVELDLRGTADAVLKRLDDLVPRPGPGRPKLGVVAREVTLLPRHWEWLALQPGGASATLRKLVEAAQKKSAGKDEQRRAQDAAYRFMTAMAGDLPHYEEALRALFAGKSADFAKRIARWPADLRKHAAKLARPAFGE